MPGPPLASGSDSNVSVPSTDPERTDDTTVATDAWETTVTVKGSVSESAAEVLSSASSTRYRRSNTPSISGVPVSVRAAESKLSPGGSSGPRV